MDKLIAELEQATEGSRELDCKIAIHPSVPQVGDVRKGAEVSKLLGCCADASAIMRGCSINADWLGVPALTTSLDAALTLVPEGAYWAVRVSISKFAGVVTPLGCVVKDCVANRPSLALCIAALKARQAMERAA